MEMLMKSSSEGRPVRKCKVVSESATSFSEGSVFCLRLEQSLPASECARCELGGGLRKEDGRDVVECRWPTREAPMRAIIGDHMSDGVVTVTPALPLEELRAILARESITGVPVVDEEGRALGVVSRSDLSGQTRGTVADVMTTGVFAMSERASLVEAAALMAYEGVHRIVVVNDERRVVGVLSVLDVAAWVAREHGYVIPPAPWSTQSHRDSERGQGGF
jgi:CBS domain-containing protein